LTRSDIAHAVQQVCLYMHAPREPHLNLVKRILRYVKGSLDLGLCFHATLAALHIWTRRIIHLLRALASPSRTSGS
jgi:hypothetical protein